MKAILILVAGAASAWLWSKAVLGKAGPSEAQAASMMVLVGWAFVAVATVAALLVWSS